MVKIRLDEALGEVYFTEYRAAFFTRVLENKVYLEEILEKRFSYLLDEMASLIGGDDTPMQVRRYAGRWEDISDNWSTQKVKKIGANPGENLFYRGTTLSGKYEEGISQPDPVSSWGAPVLSLGKLRAFRGRTGERIDPSRIDVSGGRLRYNGRFAARDDLFQAQMTLTVLPDADHPSDLLDPFDPHTANILYYNERFGEPRQKARPFLGPMIDYYSEIVLPQRLIREVNRI